MSKKKKIMLISFLFLFIVGFVGFGIYYYDKNQTYTYEWVKVEDSSVGQYRLFIKNSFGKPVDGTARLVYINGKTKKVDVDKEGLLYVKDVVAEVRNPRKR